MHGKRKTLNTQKQTQLDPRNQKNKHERHAETQRDSQKTVWYTGTMKDKQKQTQTHWVRHTKRKTDTEMGKPTFRHTGKVRERKDTEEDTQMHKKIQRERENDAQTQ